MIRILQLVHSKVACMIYRHSYMHVDISRSTARHNGMQRSPWSMQYATTQWGPSRVTVCTCLVDTNCIPHLVHIDSYSIKHTRPAMSTHVPCTH